MFFQTLAKEDPEIRVLNWAPGPMETDMQVLCRQCADDKTRQMFIGKAGRTLTGSYILIHYHKSSHASSLDYMTYPKFNTDSD